MSEETTSLHQLLAARAEVLSSGHNWQDYTDEQCEGAMAKLQDIQESIIQFPLANTDAKLAVMTALLDSNDQPGFADNFKNRLFEALRAYANTRSHL